MEKMRLFAAVLAAGMLTVGCQQHEPSGQGDDPQEHDGAVPTGAIPAPPRESQPGLGQEASPEPSSDSARVESATGTTAETAGQAPR